MAVWKSLPGVVAVHDLTRTTTNLVSPDFIVAAHASSQGRTSSVRLISSCSHDRFLAMLLRRSMKSATPISLRLFFSRLTMSECITFDLVVIRQLGGSADCALLK